MAQVSAPVRLSDRIAALSRFRFAALLGAGLVAALAIAARIPFLAFKSGDYRFHLELWSEYIQSHGLAAILRVDYADYTPPYVYLLAAALRLGLSPLVAVKALSLLFDAALILPVAGLLNASGLPRWRVLAGVAMVLLAPTVVLNSAMWGQCDALYAVFILASLYFLTVNRPYLAMSAIGIGLTIKLQTLFILPVATAYTLRGRIPLAAWLVGVPIFLAVIAPPWLAGRPFMEVALIYREQAATYNQTTLNAPSFFAWLPNLPAYGAVFALSALAIIGVAVLALARFAPSAGARQIVPVGLFMLLLCPFVLPHMHDRYFYPADVLSVVYAVQQPRRWFLPVAIISASVISYIPFLWGETPVPISVGAALIVVALAVTAFDVARLASWRTPFALRPSLVHARSDAPEQHAAPSPTPAVQAVQELPE